jgi:CRP-like cAMP-binding protein
MLIGLELPSRHEPGAGASRMAALTHGDVDFASHGAVLGGLKPELLDRVIASASVRSFARGEALFRQGDLATAFFIIVHGWVKLYRLTAAGDEVVIDVLTTGETLAVAVAFTRRRHPVGAEAISGSRVLQIPVRHVVRCITEAPEVALAVMTATSQRFQCLAQQVEQLKSQSGVQRVAEFLVSLCPVDAGACVVALPYDKELITGRLGLRPESLSRAFAKLKPAGVTVDASHVAVREVGALRRLAADDGCMSHLVDRSGMPLAESLGAE